MSKQKNQIVKKQLETDGARLKLARLKANVTIPELSEKLKDKARATAIQHMESGNQSDIFKHEKIFKILGESIPIRLDIPYLEEVQGILEERLVNTKNIKGTNKGNYTNKIRNEITWVKELMKEVGKQ